MFVYLNLCIMVCFVLFQVQRIPEYDKYLNELLQETDQSHPDFDDLKRAADKVRNVSTLSLNKHHTGLLSRSGSAVAQW